MIIMKPEFRKINYPGYYWNTTENRLYTAKVNGVLRPLSLQTSSWRGKAFNGPYYHISHEGRSRIMPVFVLKLKYSKPLEQYQIEKFPMVGDDGSC